MSGKATNGKSSALCDISKVTKDLYDMWLASPVFLQ